MRTTLNLDDRLVKRAQELTWLVDRDDYRKIVTKAAHVVHGLRTATYVTGGAVMGRIELLRVARKELGI